MYRSQIPYAEMRAIEDRCFQPGVPVAVAAAAAEVRAREVALIRARHDRDLYSGLVAGQCRSIRMRRQDGSLQPHMLSDLAMYRRQHRALNRRFWQIKRGGQ